MWNNFISSFFKTDIGVRQGSTLSSILSALYIVLVFISLKKGQKTYFKILPFHFYLLWMTVLLFHRKNLLKNQTLFFFVATTLFFLSLTNLDLQLNMESQKSFISLDPEILNPLRRFYSITKGHLEIPWFYFWQYICLYSNKALLTTKDMKMLGNSTRGLLFFNKWLLYRIYALPIALYSLPFWYFKSALLFHPLKELRKM